MHRTIFTTHFLGTEKSRHREKIAHTDCTKKIHTNFFCTQKLYPEQFLQSIVFPHRSLSGQISLNAQQFLQTDGYATSFYTERFSFRFLITYLSCSPSQVNLLDIHYDIHIDIHYDLHYDILFDIHYDIHYVIHYDLRYDIHYGIHYDIHYDLHYDTNMFHVLQLLVGTPVGSRTQVRWFPYFPVRKRQEGSARLTLVSGKTMGQFLDIPEKTRGNG